MDATSRPVLLVTGASAGIGAATARLFAREGYRVALAARRIDRLAALAGEIEAAGGEALPIQVDVTRLEDIQRMVQVPLEHFGQIDVFFNNAGLGRFGWLEELDPQEDIRVQLDTNLVGVILAARAVLPPMIARRQGTIINMASIASLVATPTYSIYAASKFGVRGFTDALRREVAVYNIQVCGIYPGGVTTEFASQTRRGRKTGMITPAALRLQANQVARAVLRLARRPRRALVLPWFMQVGAWAAALFPGLSDWLIERIYVRRARG